MNSNRTTIIRSHRSTTNRDNRHLLIQKNPPAWQCLFAYGAIVSLPVGALFFVKQHRPDFELWPAFTVLVIFLGWVAFRATRSRRPKEPVRGLMGYVLIGMLAGFIGVAASIVVEQAVVASVTAEATAAEDEEEKGPEEPEGGHEDEPLIEESAAATEEPGTNADFVASVAEEKGSDVTGDPEPEPSEEPLVKPVEQPTISTAQPPTIPTAEPIVLPAGTRLEWEQVDSNTIDIRLEERPGQLVTGLLKTDFIVQTVDGQKLAFDIVETEGRGVAVRSSIVILVDEELSIARQQADVPESLNTVLRNSSYADYRFVSAGTSIRTLTDWTSSSELIRTAFPRLRKSTGNAFPAAVSLNLSELSRRPNRRILVLVTDAAAAVANDPSFQRRLSEHDIRLVIIGSRNTLTGNHALVDSVMAFDDPSRLEQRMRSLTIRHEAPSYRLQFIGNRPDIRLKIGSGHSAVTEIIPATKLSESVTARPSR